MKFAELRKKRGAKFALLIFILLVISLALFFFIRSRENECEKDLILYGNIDVRQVDLGFRVMGRVDKLLYEEGDLVEQGELIAILEKCPYVEALHVAEANAIEAKASWDNAKLEIERRDHLEDPAAISREERDKAFYQEAAMKASYEAAVASCKEAEINLDDTEVFSPTRGTILTRIREPGTVVNVGDPVITLSIESPVWVRTFVTERELGKIYPGMPAEITTDTPCLGTYKGHIGFISPVAEFTPKNVESTTLRPELVYRLRVIVDNPGGFLRQGMPVTVKLLRGPCER